MGYSRAFPGREVSFELCHGEGSMVRLSHGPAKYSEETVDSKLKREEKEGEGSSPSAAINTGGAWCVRTEAKGGYL